MKIYLVDIREIFYICYMKILIDIPEDVSDQLIALAKDKGWNRKQYIAWQLSYHAKLNTSRKLARSHKLKK